MCVHRNVRGLRHPRSVQDLLHDGHDLVCVIPREYIEPVLEEAEKKHVYELKRRESIAAYIKAKAEGSELPQLAPQWVLDMLKR